MKTKEELNAIKNKVEALKKKLAELTEEELAEVTGGSAPTLPATELSESGCVNIDPASNRSAKHSYNLR